MNFRKQPRFLYLFRPPSSLILSRFTAIWLVSEIESSLLRLNYQRIEFVTSDDPKCTTADALVYIAHMMLLQQLQNIIQRRFKARKYLLFWFTEKFRFSIRGIFSLSMGTALICVVFLYSRQVSAFYRQEQKTALFRRPATWPHRKPHFSEPGF